MIEANTGQAEIINPEIVVDADGTNLEQYMQRHPEGLVDPVLSRERLLQHNGLARELSNNEESAFYKILGFVDPGFQDKIVKILKLKDEDTVRRLLNREWRERVRMALIKRIVDHTTPEETVGKLDKVCSSGTYGAEVDSFVDSCMAAFKKIGTDQNEAVSTTSGAAAGAETPAKKEKSDSIWSKWFKKPAKQSESTSVKPVEAAGVSPVAAKPVEAGEVPATEVAVVTAAEAPQESEVDAQEGTLEYVQEKAAWITAQVEKYLQQVTEQNGFVDNDEAVRLKQICNEIRLEATDLLTTANADSEIVKELWEELNQLDTKLNREISKLAIELGNNTNPNSISNEIFISWEDYKKKAENESAVEALQKSPEIILIDEDETKERKALGQRAKDFFQSLANKRAQASVERYANLPFTKKDALVQARQEGEVVIDEIKSELLELNEKYLDTDEKLTEDQTLSDDEKVALSKEKVELRAQIKKLKEELEEEKNLNAKIDQELALITKDTENLSWQEKLNEKTHRAIAAITNSDLSKSKKEMAISWCKGYGLSMTIAFGGGMLASAGATELGMDPFFRRWLLTGIGAMIFSDGVGSYVRTSKIVKISREKSGLFKTGFEKAADLAFWIGRRNGLWLAFTAGAGLGGYMIGGGQEADATSITMDEAATANDEITLETSVADAADPLVVTEATPIPQEDSPENPDGEVIAGAGSQTIGELREQMRKMYERNGTYDFDALTNGTYKPGTAAFSPADYGDPSSAPNANNLTNAGLVAMRPEDAQGSEDVRVQIEKAVDAAISTPGESTGHLSNGETLVYPVENGDSIQVVAEKMSQQILEQSGVSVAPAQIADAIRESNGAAIAEHAVWDTENDRLQSADVLNASSEGNLKPDEISFRQLDSGEIEVSTRKQWVEGVRAAQGRGDAEKIIGKAIIQLNVEQADGEVVVSPELPSAEISFSHPVTGGESVADVAKDLASQAAGTQSEIPPQLQEVIEKGLEKLVCATNEKHQIVFATDEAAAPYGKVRGDVIDAPILNAGAVPDSVSMNYDAKADTYVLKLDRNWIETGRKDGVEVFGSVEIRMNAEGQLYLAEDSVQVSPSGADLATQGPDLAEANPEAATTPEQQYDALKATVIEGLDTDHPVEVARIIDFATTQMMSTSNGETAAQNLELLQSYPNNLYFEKLDGVVQEVLKDLDSRGLNLETVSEQALSDNGYSEVRREIVRILQDRPTDRATGVIDTLLNDREAHLAAEKKDFAGAIDAVGKRMM